MPFNNSANSATQPYVVKYDSDTPYSPSSYTGSQKSQWIENTGSSAISVLNYNNQIVKIEPGQISFFYKTDSDSWVNTDRTSEIKRLTTTETNLIAGDYDIDSTLSSFSISLADMKGVWRFHNTNHSISSNTVTLTSLSSQTYTNEGGVQIDDDFIINASGKPFVVLHTEIGDDYRVSVEPSMGLVSSSTTSTPQVSVYTYTGPGDGGFSWVHAFGPTYNNTYTYYGSGLIAVHLLPSAVYHISYTSTTPADSTVLHQITDYSTGVVKNTNTTTASNGDFTATVYTDAGGLAYICARISGDGDITATLVIHKIQ